MVGSSDSVIPPIDGAFLQGASMAHMLGGFGAADDPLLMAPREVSLAFFRGGHDPDTASEDVELVTEWLRSGSVRAAFC